VLERLEVIPVGHMDRVLKEALAGPRAEEIFGRHEVTHDIAVDGVSSAR